MDKEKKAQAIIAFLKKHPDQFFSANKVNKALGFPPEADHHAWGSHGILSELKTAGVVEQKKGHGFRYIAFDDRKVG